MIVEAVKSKFCKAGQQIGDPVRTDSAIWVQNQYVARILSSLRDVSNFFIKAHPHYGE